MKQSQHKVANVGVSLAGILVGEFTVLDFKIFSKPPSLLQSLNL